MTVPVALCAGPGSLRMAWRHGFGVVDAHIHLPRTDGMKPDLAELLRDHPAFVDRAGLGHDPDALVAWLDGQGVERAWIITYNAAPMGYGRSEAEAVWDLCARSDRLIAVGGFDPARDGDAAVAVGTMKSAGVRVIKIHPVHQGLDPADRRFEPLYDAASRAGMPVVVHTGPSVFPGADNSKADPALLDPVLRAWPDLDVLVAHGGRPDHTQEAVRLVQRHDRAWLELSGCPPARLKDYFGDLEALAERTVWGSDWPGPKVPDLAVNIEAFLGLGLSDHANRAILRDNAMRLVP